MSRRRILIVDDEPDMLQLLKRSLEPDLDCSVTTTSSAREAVTLIAEEPVDLVLADIKMPEMDGLELLEVLKRNRPDLTVVMMTGHGSIDTAVASMKNGAHDFITKPFDHETLVVRLEKALERSQLVSENDRLIRECRSEDVFENMAGSSTAMQRVYETVRMVAGNDLTVLITGESGTGKDLTARAIHSLSPRRKRPFIAVNCPTVPEHILESELFGYKRGAFTHATRDKKGLFQEAHTGTIFLDEIGDINPTIQTKLLRVLQEKEIKPLGDARPVTVDVRIITSTNQPLQDKIASGDFREDFFYRINVLPIHLPPLRDRRDDIPLIASHLLARHCAALGKPLKRFSAGLLRHLCGAPWKGNVRELENMIIRGIMFSSGAEIRRADIGSDSIPATHERETAAPVPTCELIYREAKEQVLKGFNEEYIGTLLRQTGGNVTRAARLCGLERQSLQQIMRRYGIRSEQYRH